MMYLPKGKVWGMRGPPAWVGICSRTGEKKGAGPPEKVVRLTVVKYYRALYPG